MALPDFEILFLKTPLYEVFEIHETGLEELFELFHFNGRLDYYCPFCKKDSTFEGVRPTYPNLPHYDSYKTISKIANNSQRKNVFEHHLGDGIRTIRFNCTRDRSHFTAFSFHYFKNTLIKVGQFPSISELNQDRIKKYRKVLSTEQYKELNRGIGLTAHGVGIGSYVYLRRIFENLIFEAIQKSIAAKERVEKDFEGQRINEKIKLLENYVPEFLYENKDIYGLLSKGIHELSENECLEFFPVLQVGIELILDEKYEAALREEKKKNISKELDRIKNIINKK